MAVAATMATKGGCIGFMFIEHTCYRKSVFWMQLQVRGVRTARDTHEHYARRYAYHYGDIVINVASSGIAALLLTGGRTARLCFAIPINMQEDSFCSIRKDSELSKLLNKAKLIIWDEAPMMHRNCFEAFDRTMRDIIVSPNSNAPFDGKVVVFGGDFHQILPLLRNMDQSKGLCNSTRLLVERMAKHTIEAHIITSHYFGNLTYIPRMMIAPTDKKIAVKFQRRQFPIDVCFAMTINKSQGQSLSNVGLFLRKLVFTHDQLYVVVSRVMSKKGLKVIILDENGNDARITKNVVYKEVL
ncbi:uncharacterized protein [Rutidosis leptorrhynchoides]|uniref:uncharacterized protein n=1 Tax=Rutidosis leptorrhynchoides TaxID=125765 RepID=UPI003A993D99